MSRKESVTVIMDITKFMFKDYLNNGEDEIDDGKTNFDIAKEACLMLYQQKLLYAGKSHKVALMTYNDTNYKIVQDYETVSIEMAKEYRNIMNEIQEPKNQSGDPFLALSTALKEINQFWGKKKCSHKIFFITSLVGKSVYEEDDIQDIINILNQRDIKINVICFDYLNKKNEHSKSTNMKLLNKILDNCKAQLFSAEEAISIYRDLNKKIFSLTTKFRGFLEISPDLKIGVMGYTKSNDQKIKSLQKYSKATDYDKGEKTNKIQNERIQFAYDDPEMKPIPEENIIRGFEYGNEIVPIPKEFEDKLKVRDEEKCLKILGFTSKKNVPRHHYLSGVDMIVPSVGKENTQAFNSIVLSLLDSKKMGIARYSMRKNSAPKLVALHPDFVEDIGYVIYIISIPTAEDLREYSFASLEKSTESQQQKVGQLINKMSLITGDVEQVEDGEIEELVKPEELYNPILQHLNSVLLDRAFDIENDISNINPRIIRDLYPEKITAQQAEELFQEIKEEFGLKELEMGEQQAKRIFWRNIADKQAQDVKNQLEQTPQEAVANKSKPEVGEDYIKKISDIHPISDFKDMFNNKKVDLVVDAIEQMQQLIIKMIDESLKSSHLQKAYDCLEALRKGCVDEDECDKFNQFMIDLKIKFTNSNKKSFWKMVVTKGVGLISKAESPDSDVSIEAAKEYIREMEQLIEEDGNIQKIDEDEDDEMLLDIE